jgi:hypothetical protein
MDITMEQQKKADDAEAKLAQIEEQWKTWGVVEIAVRNPSVSEYMNHWEGRATKAEAENEDLKGIISGLQDVAAGRIKPLEEIEKDMEKA